MPIKKWFRNRLSSLLVSMGVLLILYLAMEGYLYKNRPSESNKQALIHYSLEKAVEKFNDHQARLKETTLQMSSDLKKELKNRKQKDEAYEILRRSQPFWGSTLFKNDSIWVWYKYSSEKLFRTHLPDSVQSFTNVQKKNNVVYLACQVPFTTSDTTGTTHYTLLSTSRLEQANALPIGGKNEYHLEPNARHNQTYPVHFTFFNPLPEGTIVTRTLSTPSSDSVGVVYAFTKDYNAMQTEWVQQLHFWRIVFAGLVFVVLAVFYFSWGYSLSGWKILLTNLSGILLIWLLFNRFSIPDYWLQQITDNLIPVETGPMFDKLSHFFIHSLFIFFASITLVTSIVRNRRFYGISWYPRTVFFAMIYGFLNAVTFPILINHVYELVLNTNLQVVDLQIFPDIATVFLYVSTATLIISAFISLIALGWFLFNTEQEQLSLAMISTVFSFIIALLFFQPYVTNSIFDWTVILTLLIFAVIFATAFYLHLHPRKLVFVSRLRLLSLACLTAAIIGYPIFYSAHTKRQDKEMLTHAREFIKEQDPFAEEITKRILIELEQKLNYISEEDIQNRKENIQARFTQAINEIIADSWKKYSIDLQLIKPNGDLIADYSTNLNSPNWVSIYDLNFLKAPYELQRITKSTNRPFVPKPLGENSKNYGTFYKGWIPIFDQKTPEHIAWILCSVYTERPDFDKPIRALLASKNYKNWQTSYYMVEYRGGRKIRSATNGISTNFPIYNKLTPPTIAHVNNDSLVYRTRSADHLKYRELLLKVDDNQIIKIDTPLSNLQNHLFYFFRYTVTLFLLGLVVMQFLVFLGYDQFRLFGQSNRFRNRLLDSFLLSTLIFLSVLVGVTHYIITRQNERNVKHELIGKLDNLSRSLQSTKASMTNITLDAFTSPLNVDATFYVGRDIQASTTPQIYQQNLLPSTMPYEVYDALYNRQKEQVVRNLKLGNQPLMVGYQAIKNDREQPIGAIAIPTFPQSPKYNDQLLEITSYLLVFYILIFGFFIIGATLLSRQLTKPISNIKSGLKRISSGDLDTTIPVTSKDEIGSLANAYNLMVYKLKDLQEELAEAERQAAWKEMARQIAHEIKNPLTPMKLNIQHLKRQIAIGRDTLEQLKPKVNKIADNLIEQIESLNHIASDFSRFAKPIKEEFEDAKLNEIIESIGNLYKHDDQTQIKMDLTDEEMEIHCVPDELKRVFINLVKNSSEAMPNGGIIMIRTYRHSGQATVEVADNGSGIPEKLKSRIFVPNFSTKSSGTGLGLAITKKIVEAHNGSITFASVEGTGTTFTVQVPLKNGQQANQFRDGKSDDAEET